MSTYTIITESFILSYTAATEEVPDALAGLKHAGYRVRSLARHVSDTEIEGMTPEEFALTEIIAPVTGARVTRTLCGTGWHYMLGSNTLLGKSYGEAETEIKRIAARERTARGR